MKVDEQHFSAFDDSPFAEGFKKLVEAGVIPPGKQGLMPAFLFKTFAMLQYVVGKKFQSYELSPAQTKVLHMISRMNGCSLTQLQAVMRYSSKQNLSSLTKRLIKQGYLIQQSDDNDKRVKKLFLSDSGVKTINELIPKHLEVIAEVFSVLTEEEADSFISLFSKISRKLEEMDKREHN